MRIVSAVCFAFALLIGLSAALVAGERLSQKQMDNGNAVLQFARSLEHLVTYIVGDELSSLFGLEQTADSSSYDLANFLPQDGMHNQEIRQVAFLSNTGSRRSVKASGASRPHTLADTVAYNECVHGVYARYRVNTTQGPFSRSGCFCPLDYVGSNCNVQRRVACTILQVWPQNACVATGNYIGYPVCLQRVSSEVESYRFTLSCAFSQSAQGIPFTVPGGFNDSVLLEVRNIGLSANTSLAVGALVTMKQLMDAFGYSFIGSSPAVVADPLYLSADPHWDLIFHPIDFAKYASAGGEVQVRLSEAEVQGARNVTFNVDYGRIPASFKQFGRMYAEVGFVFNETISYVAEEDKKYVQIVVDFTDYLEPASTVEQGLVVLIATVCVAAVLSFLAVVWAVHEHRKEIRHIVVKRHEFLNRKKLS
eukprot:ANDGO_04417.mRNA.1 hypothetical protein